MKLIPMVETLETLFGDDKSRKDKQPVSKTKTKFQFEPVINPAVFDLLLPNEKQQAIFDQVTKGLGLPQPIQITNPIKGTWQWRFDVSQHEWENKFSPTIEERLVRLYDNHAISNGGWPNYCTFYISFLDKDCK